MENTALRNRASRARRAILLFALAGLLLPAPGHAAKPESPRPRPPAFATLPEVRAFIVDMHEQYGFDIAQLNADFSKIRSNETVLRAIRPAAVPELQRSWQRYRERFVNARRIGHGLSFWEHNAAALARAQTVYGVAPEIVVAIIGVETEYGRNMGKFSVLEALATLAFNYPPRAPFFRAELEHYLLLARENRFPALALKGSYAGAIGIPQFMPSSLRNYAVDFDGDERIDLSRSTSDAIGSVARYLQLHGWQAGAPVAVPAFVAGDPTALITAGIKPALSVAEFAQAGVGVGGDATALGERPGALIDLVSPDQPTEYWVGFANFYAITRYNRSSFYAMAVFQLAEALRDAHRQTRE